MLGSPLRLDDARSGAEALVLTEWKRVIDPAELKEKQEQALSQAKRYTSRSGSLGG